MRAQRMHWSGLDCVLAQTTESPQGLVVFCHGFGAPGTDLIDLAPALVQLAPELASLAFFFPAAPLDLSDSGLEGGRAWWPIDMQELVEAVQFGKLRDLRKQVPPTLSAVRAQLKEVILSACQHFELKPEQTILGGFSQGSMITSAVALQEDLSVAGLCVLSGTLLCEDEWTTALKVRDGQKKKPFPVFQSHGQWDPILPFSNAEALRDLFTASGHEVEFVPFAGQHQIPQTVLQHLARWLVLHT